MVYWITGRKGAGKTFFANQMAERFRADGKSVLILDGDDFRKRVTDFGYTDEGRKANIMMIAKIGALAEAQGIMVIISLISPKIDWRQEARQYFEASELIYIPGGTLWPGTVYEEPVKEEKAIRFERRTL